VVQTPGHATLNVALLTGLWPLGMVASGATVAAPPSATAMAAAILAGAILPDLPIVVLYLRERARGTPEDVIWSDHYQRRFWQDLIHGMHALPVALAGLVVSLLLSSPLGMAFFASQALHAACDLPVHAHDAHRHFFPLSNYRFISPLSYWDPRYHAAQVALVEALLVAGASCVLWWRSPSLWGRLALLAVNLFYAVGYYRTFVRRPSPAATA
jgi:hypothetical protein